MLFSSKPKLLFSCFSRKQKTCVSEKNRVFFFHEERCTKKVSVSGKKKHVGFCIRTLHHSLMEREGVAPHFLERGRDFVVYPLSFFFNKKKKKKGERFEGDFFRYPFLFWKGISLVISIKFLFERERRFFSLSISFLEKDFVLIISNQNFSLKEKGGFFSLSISFLEKDFVYYSPLSFILFLFF